mgnify:CR=1 FL=1
MSERIKKIFETKGKKLVTFTTGGDPDFNTSLEILKTIINNGIDIIEIGMPFSDPMADGPTIQESSVRSLSSGTKINDIFEIVVNIRKFNNKIPIILMGYYNSIFNLGIDNFSTGKKFFLNNALKDKNSTNSVKFLKENYQTMKLMNSRRREMWKASRWNHYNDFRVFIMGVKGNEELFGDGVIYEGVWDEPKQFRGQTGAQDDIIPMEDIFSGVIKHYPKNELTKYLIDLRSYRPKCIQEFFKDLEDTVNELSEEGISFVLSKQNNSEGLCYLLGVLEEIYHFRNGHWQFVQKYIMANTKYAKATGGTPIISWLPNQMKDNFPKRVLASLFPKLHIL